MLLSACAVFSSVYAPPILMFVRPARARRLFRGVAVVAILVVIPSCIGGATDGFEYQMECTFLCFSSILLILAFGLGYIASRNRFHGKDGT
jgi:hypothetical protein